MFFHKAYKYRIYPNRTQQQLIHQMFGCCRFVFNHFLGQWKDTFDATGKGLSYHACATQLPDLKQEHPWLKKTDSIALQSAVRHVADSFDRFFKEQTQAPRFKNRKHPVQSYKGPIYEWKYRCEWEEAEAPEAGVAAVCKLPPL